MERIFGLDLGTTSIGFAVIERDGHNGVIRQLGVRLFPEARDPKGTPFNQTRRDKRMARRQLRRRRQRRDAVRACLAEAGLLPDTDAGSEAWASAMAADPVALRARGLAESLAPHELGRALYHLAKRRHFRARDLADSAESKDDGDKAAEEKAAQSGREQTLAALRDGRTLGQLLAEKAGRNGRHPYDKASGAGLRHRGTHADRKTVKNEFMRLCRTQAPYHPPLRDPDFIARFERAAFSQRPVFWRGNTLGTCPLIPDDKNLCPRGAWLSQQRRMLEKLNNLGFAGGNARPLDAEERAAILAVLQTQAGMSWGAARKALKPLFKARGMDGPGGDMIFNLEAGGEKGLHGNKLEAKLAAIFKAGWAAHPHKQAIRDCLQQRLWEADYRSVNEGQRIEIRLEAERAERREAARRHFVDLFGIAESEAEALAWLDLPSGWEPFSVKALQAMLPELEAGIRFGALLHGPEWAAWRDRCFPDRAAQPTGEELPHLPSPDGRSPGGKDEQRRLTGLRNPTVTRVLNEMRKVVNNLIRAHGKPARIRIELAREIGLSKKQRQELQAAQKENERARNIARNKLEASKINPSRDNVEKWLLWDECGKQDPYSGQHIGFDDLYSGLFEIEHIWPRGQVLDDGFRNKTLCRRDFNTRKHARLPAQAFAGDPDEWQAMKDRVWRCVKLNGMSVGKAKRFCREQPLDPDFTARQLNDTGFAARQALASLKRLWPDLGPEAPVRVEAVSGRVTAQLRHLWELNGILSADGRKSRDDHRHHAVDALAVACVGPNMVKALSDHWQARDAHPDRPKPDFAPPWPTIRAEATAQLFKDDPDWSVVSYRVRRKVSGPLHKETVYGDTGRTETRNKIVYRKYVARKPMDRLSGSELDTIRDDGIRRIVKDWMVAHGGDLKKAFATSFPRVSPNGPQIRKVRFCITQQQALMAKVSTGYADRGSNHHIAFYRLADGGTAFETVSLFEAADRQARHRPVVQRTHHSGGRFVMSLALNEALRFSEGPHCGIWIVRSVKSNGQIELKRHIDARSGKDSEAWLPRINAILTEGGQKISIDPIGRIRPARD